MSGDNESYQAWEDLANRHIRDDGPMGTMARALATAVQQVRESLSDDEVQALKLTADLAGVLHRIIYLPSRQAPVSMHGRLRDVATQDWTEAAQHIHVLQHMIMSQAAGRTNPALCRMLGNIL